MVRLASLAASVPGHILTRISPRKDTMRVFLSAALAVVLISSVSACRFCWNDSWVDCDDRGSNCAVEAPTPTATPVIVVPTPKPTATAVPTPVATPAPTATPCPAGLSLILNSSGVYVCGAPQGNGGAA